MGRSASFLSDSALVWTPTDIGVVQLQLELANALFADVRRKAPTDMSGQSRRYDEQQQQHQQQAGGDGGDAPVFGLLPVGSRGAWTTG